MFEFLIVAPDRFAPRLLPFVGRTASVPTTSRLGRGWQESVGTTSYWLAPVDWTNWQSGAFSDGAILLWVEPRLGAAGFTRTVTEARRQDRRDTLGAVGRLPRPGITWKHFQDWEELPSQNRGTQGMVSGGRARTGPLGEKAHSGLPCLLRAGAVRASGLQALSGFAQLQGRPCTYNRSPGHDENSRSWSEVRQAPQYFEGHRIAGGESSPLFESSPFLVETLHGSRWVMQPSSSISSTSSPQFSALAGGLRGALEDDGSRSPSSGAVRCR